jgi:urease accessory protein
VGADRLALLQLCDSLFPVGSFAHSDGLEAAVADGHVARANDLRDWLNAQLRSSLTDSDGPAVRDAMGAIRDADLDRIAAVDDELYAMRPSATGREASRSQGRRLLNTWQHIRPSGPVATAIAARPFHTFPVAFGIVCGAMQIAVHEALEAYFYTRLAGGVSAAMRLMPLGQHDAQRILADLLADTPDCVARVEASCDRPRAFSPHLDIASMRQQYVHSRLFRS